MNDPAQYLVHMTSRGPKVVNREDGGVGGPARRLGDAVRPSQAPLPRTAPEAVESEREDFADVTGWTPEEYERHLRTEWAAAADK